ncbi:MAG: type IV pilus secretin PilQ [Gallionellaceae bacterium]|nr:type IV pilus secretin PilQ [Gallionellaceae bacterium]
MKATFPPMHLAGLRWLATACVLLLALPAYSQTPAQTQQEDSRQNTLSAVSLARGNNDSQVVKLVFKNPVGELPIAFTTSNPHRLVLDFPATGSALPRSTEAAEGGSIKNWQVAQAGQRTRVVLNLNGPANYELRMDRNLVLAVLRAIPVSPDTPAPARFAEAGPARAHGIRDLEFRRGKDGESRITVSLSDPGVGVDIKKQGGAIQVEFLNTSLPTPLQRRLDVTDFATPAQLVETFEQGKNTRMLVTPKGKWDYSAYQTGTLFTLEVRSLEGPQADSRDKPQYSGEKLSLNFQNVEVRSVLQVIADFTGLNIITSDTVSGNVTLRLKDVPWDQALDIILRAKGLDQRATGNVIWIAPRDELTAKEKLEKESRQQIAELEDVTTEFIRLNYLRASDAQAIIKGQSLNAAGASEKATCATKAGGIGGAASQPAAATGAGAGQSILSKRGNTSYDSKTNTLFVQDTPSKIKEIKAMIASVDVPSKQVMIEARIVVADDAFGRTLGARLGFQGSASGRGGGAGTRVGLSNTLGGSNTAAAGTGLTTTPTNVNLPATLAVGTLNLSSASTLGFTVINAASTAILGLELQALEADKRGKIVSNPRVITQNQKPAVILQGQQIPYQSSAGGTAGATTTSFVDALLCLLVDPQVLNNDTIILDVEVQKDAAGAAPVAGGAPPINVKRVKTQVRVKNGETAVLGGIFEQELRNDTEKVPFLGDIPILGHLFKSNIKGDIKTELLIFLTPRILDDAVALQ